MYAPNYDVFERVNDILILYAETPPTMHALETLRKHGIKGLPCEKPSKLHVRPS